MPFILTIYIPLDFQCQVIQDQKPTLLSIPKLFQEFLESYSVEEGLLILARAIAALVYRQVTYMNGKGMIHL